MSALVARRRLRLATKSRPHFQGPTDELEALTDEDLREFVARADAVLEASRPRVSDALYGEATRSIRRWLRLAGRMVEGEIDRYARGAAKRFTIRKSDFSVSSGTWATLEDELASVMADLYAGVNAEAVGAASAELGILYDPSLRQTLSAEEQAFLGQQVTRITESSREQLAAAVATATERGYSTDQLVSGVRSDGFTGLRGMVARWGETGINDRASLIALTETGNAYNLSSLNAYERSGLVGEVNVYDGPSCGWTTHTDPQAANGRRVSIAEAKATPLAHPRCQRSFGPVVVGAPARGAPGGQNVPTPQIGPQPLPSSPFDANARAAAARVYSEAARDQGAVTALLRDLEGQGLGNLQGLDYRLKADMDRTIEKILGDLGRGDSLTQAERVKDALRFTFVSEPESYWSSVQTISEALERAGYRAIKWGDNWATALSKDLNSAWLSPQGGRFELQFHTPESWYRKTIAGPDGLPPSHKVYETFRDLEAGDARRAELERVLRQIWADVEPPPGEAWAPDLFADSAALAEPSAAATYAARLTVLDDPEVMALRAQLDETLAGFDRPNLSLEEYRDIRLRANALETAMHDATWAARSRIEAEVGGLSASEARAALSEVQAELRVVTEQLEARPTAAGAFSRLQLRRADLTDLAARLERQVPLEDRVLAAPTGTIERQLYDTLRQMYGAIRDELGLETRWTGEVGVGKTGANMAALFDWSSGIRISRSAASYAEADYRALVLHEAFHGLSELSPNGLLYAQGWEEGVVEMAARTFAPAIYRRLGWDTGPGYSSYSKWTSPLERIRNTLGLTAETYYGALIRLPATRRGTWVIRALDAYAAEHPDQLATVNVARALLLTLGYAQPSY